MATARSASRRQLGSATGMLALWAVAAMSLIVMAASAALVLGKGRGEALDLGSLPSDTRHAYELAATNRALFSHLPCYCGCAALAVPHRSLEDCFLDADGGFVTHASSCSTCVDIALEAEGALGRGLDHAQIGRLIDEQFAARGPRTPTTAP